MSQLFSHEILKKAVTPHNTLQVVRVPHMPVDLLAVVYPVGSRNDPQGHAGLTHLCEHILLRRTKQHPAAIKRLRALERVHIDFEALVTREFTAFLHEQIPRTSLRSTALLLDGVFDAIFDADDVAREKHALLQEIAEHEVDAVKCRHGLGMRALWGDTPLAHDLSGTREEVVAITTAAVKSHCQQFLAPHCAQYLFIGEGDPDAIADRIAVRYRDTAPHPPRSCTVPRQQSPPHSKVTPRVHLATDRFGENIIYVGVYVRTCNAHEMADRAALAIMRNYLAGSWSSFLMEEMRVKRGMAYSVESDTEYFSDTGYLEVTYAVAPKDFDESVAIVQGGFRRLRARGIGERRLQTIVESIVTDMQKVRMGAGALFDWYVGDVARGTPVLSMHAWRETLRALTHGDIVRVARQYLKDENVALVSVGAGKE